MWLGSFLQPFFWMLGLGDTLQEYRKHVLSESEMKKKNSSLFKLQVEKLGGRFGFSPILSP